MKLSAKSYYALKGLAHLARTQKPGSVAKISLEEKIPAKYLEKIFQQLKGAGLLSSHKGVDGGYNLARKASRINLGQIIGVLEGGVSTAPCSRSACSQDRACAEKRFWQSLAQNLNRALEKVTIDQLIK